MATPKTITATDIEQGSLNLRREGSTIFLERRYDFVEAGGNVIDELKGGRLTAEMAIADVPAPVVAALATIDAWTYAQALAQEGMT
jgi:hypothetical protein